MKRDFLWWRDGVIYQIYPRSFSDSNGDGIGDLPGIISRLDYLQMLGVDAIWLSPIYPSPDKDFGYDISDYENVDPQYGTLADFDKLVDQAHQREIRVILDGVFNHTSDQHPWFQESRSSKHNPFREWYYWRPPSPDGSPPNNWQSVFGGHGWEYDTSTEEFYFHLFLKEQPDLNWHNPSVPRAILNVMRFWLDRGVDGFRLDVFNAYYKNKHLPDNPPKFGIRGFDRQHHIHDISQPEMMPFLSDLRNLLDAYPQRYAVGETFLETSEKTAQYVGVNALHGAFNFDFLNQSWKADQFLRSIQVWEAALGEDRWPNYVMNNHDVPRSTTRYRMAVDDAQAKLAAMLLLTLRGTPFLYYGEEIGMRDIRLSRKEIVDPPGKKYWPIYTGRDGCRSPMQWDDGDHAGFSNGKSWLPVHPNYRSRNVKNQQDDPDSLLGFYQRMIQFRKDNPVLQYGKWTPLAKNFRNTLSYFREDDEKTFLITLNFSPKATTTVLPGTDTSWKIKYSTHKMESANNMGEIKMDGFQGLIFERENKKPF